MKDQVLQRITGCAGVLMYLTVMTVIPLFFVYEGAPPLSNILARVFVSMFTSAAFLILLVGLRELLKRAAPDHEFLSSLSFHSGFAYFVLMMVADSVQVGAALAHGSPVDPTLVGSGGEAAFLIWGPLSRLLTGIFLCSSGAAIIASRIVPRWLAWLAFPVAALHFALVPTIFSGTDPTHFYSINGLGIPTAGGLFALWILFVSIALLMRSRSRALVSGAVEG